ncbi:MAG TPA: acyltransferase domain-containing protein, partial [Acholeplasma sp.]|nr:acyltransferase domain-containing protein [Acholeplasma sp.]
MNKLAVVFAGQGSQYQGMGQEFFEGSNLYDQASRLLGYDVKDMISSGNGLLNETIYTQPLVFLTSVVIYEAFKELNVNPEGYLGFSLGEYGALYASGVYHFIDCLSLINRRATYMDAETKKYKGTMFALL